jgi:hypothetical protein
MQGPALKTLKITVLENGPEICYGLAAPDGARFSLLLD